MSVRAIKDGDQSRIKRLLEDRGIKPIWVAEQANIHRSHLSKIVLGHRTCPAQVADRIASALQVERSEFFAEVSRMSP